MATNRLEPAPAGAEAGAAAAPPGANAGGTPGGLKAWLPLLVALVAMPLLAYVTTSFILLPKLQQAMSRPGEAAGSAGKAAAKEEANKPKHSVPLSKVLVNVSGSVGTRYLIASYTLVGNSANFKSKIDESRDQLLDLAAGVMSTKTITDLEQPGSRNLIRNELISVFNNALGGNLVKEIYITEFAIQ